MHKSKRPARRRLTRVARPQALAAALALISCLQLFPASSLAQRAEQGDSRPRRVDESHKPYNQGGGPLIRVGLMTDVAKVTLSSSAELAVRRSEQTAREAQKISSGLLRVEVRAQANAAAARGPLYRIEVAAVSEARQARKISDDVKRRFGGSPSVIYNNQSGKYRVLTGQFNNKNRAAEMINRLRRAGYASARVAPDQRLLAERSGAAAKTRTKDVNKQQSGKADPKTPAQVVAFDAEKLVASSDEMLIVTPDYGASGFGQTDARDDRTRIKNTEVVNYSSPARQAAPRPLSIRVGDNNYYGEIHLLVNQRGRINVVNVLPLEEYLRGVLPMEIAPSSSAQLEALKAQAIAARSYALANLGQHRKEGFDLRDDARSQVYGGLTVEHPLTTRAIEETRGMVALHFSEDGRANPIEALYTASCGGHTEDNEAIFSGKPLPYLRSVACPIDSPPAASREIISRAMIGQLTAADGRAVAREVALVEVLGFPLPRLVTNQYLRNAAGNDETRDWIEHAARIAGRGRLNSMRGEVTRLPAFASMVVAIVYGEGRTSSLISPSDADYILSGLGGDDLPRDARADVAMLLRDAVLRLPPDGRINARAGLTRAYAIETLARAMLKSPALNAKSERGLKQAVARPAEKNRVRVIPTTPAATAARAKSSRASAEADAQEFEIEQNAWLFRRYGAESYGVERLALIGGERITYHVNSDGRIDYLEAEAADRHSLSDRLAGAAQWRERVEAGELKRRLSRSRVEVGEVEKLVPVEYAPSGRVVELEVVGSEGSARLRGYQIRSAFNLKENMFVVDEERDERDRITAFVFTGRGWGHGVGMCQSGALGMAKAGYSYMDILQKYYTGVRVQKIY